MGDFSYVSKIIYFYYFMYLNIGTMVYFPLSSVRNIYFDTVTLNLPICNYRIHLPTDSFEQSEVE
jgi:hypothetical protein